MVLLVEGKETKSRNLAGCQLLLNVLFSQNCATQWNNQCLLVGKITQFPIFQIYERSMNK